MRGQDQAIIVTPLSHHLLIPVLVTPNISLEPVAGGFNQPTDIAHAGDDRLFVAERAGYVRIIQADGTKLPAPFLDITARVDTLSDPNFGLLGLTFHPDHANNGYFYVNYTDNSTDTVISRFKVSSDSNVAAVRKGAGSKGGLVLRNADDPTHVTILLEWDSLANGRQLEQADLNQAIV